MKKGLSVAVASALVCGSLGVSVYAQEETVPTLAGGVSVQTMERGVLQKPKSVTLSDQDKEQLSKEETVYVIANADGSPQKLIVSDWLKNAAGMSTVADATELTNVSNIKGQESFQKKAGNLGVWDAEGNDIYYQGSIQKALPVDMKITYQLDGKTVSPEELAGQSGKVVIRFDYDNKQKEKVQVGEKEEELYVPFVILTGMVLDNEHFRNIQVSNGKVINDGERTMVMSYAMPGLKENLDTGSEDFDIEELEISDYVELTADVENFELATTLTVATNEIFGDMDVNMQDKMDELSGDMDELQDAMTKLMDGTSDLYDGVGELYDGTVDLDDGAQKLDDGAKKLKDGTGSLKSGAGELVNGVNTLVSGLEKLTKSNDTLVGGVKQVFQSGLDTANNNSLIQTAVPVILPGQTKLTVENYSAFSAKVKTLLKQLGVTTQVTAEPAAEEMEEPEETASDSESAKEEKPEEDNTLKENTGEEAGEETEEDAAPEQTEAEDSQLQTEQETDTDTEKEEEEDTAEQASVESKKQIQVQAAPDQNAAMQQIMAALSNPQTQAQVQAMLAQLDGLNQLYQGVLQYTAGVTQAYNGSKTLLDGAKKLNSGASELQDGAGELKDGTSELKDGTLKLKDGVTELRDGSLELKDGTVEFNEEGIEKLVNMLNGDLQDLNDRFEATKEAARAYKSFAGISDEMQGKVKFIYKTAAIEK